MFQTLFNRFFQPEPLDNEQSLTRAIDTNDIKTLRQLVKTKEQANQSIRNNSCPILYRAFSGKKYESALYLLTMGADINQFNKNNNWYPLYFAVSNGIESTIRLLLICGADPDLNLPNTVHRTARNLAKEKGLEHFISSIEIQFNRLTQLKSDYEQVKTQADNAYKKPDTKLAWYLYQDAATIYENISNVWFLLYRDEENTILKTYYDEKYKHYADESLKLRNIISEPKLPKDIATHCNLIYRKVNGRKQQNQDSLTTSTFHYSV